MVQSMETFGLNMTDPRELLLLYAAEGNHRDLTNVVDGQSDVLLRDALDLAAEHGHLECVKILLPLCNTSFSLAVWEASCNGHVEVLQFLLEQGLRIDDDLTGALEHQQWECATILMTHCVREDIINALVNSFEWEDNGATVDDIERGRRMLVDRMGAEQMICYINSLSFDNDSEYTQAIEWLEHNLAREQKARIEQHVLPQKSQRLRKI